MSELSGEAITERAIENNIALCECVAVANDIRSVSADGVWMCMQPMPPYYPNIITTEPNTKVTERIAHLREKLPAGWGIKDSFAELILEKEKYKKVISGHWISAPRSIISECSKSDVRRTVIVRSDADFERWILEWDSAMKGKIFPPDIWRDKGLQFVLVERGHQISGGFLLNTSNSDLGLSNWFGNFDDVNWALNLITTPAEWIVGYADDDELDKLASFGYKRLQALSVWICK